MGWMRNKFRVLPKIIWEVLTKKQGPQKKTPIYYAPYYHDSKKGTPDLCGTPPYSIDSKMTVASWCFALGPAWLVSVFLASSGSFQACGALQGPQSAPIWGFPKIRGPIFGSPHNKSPTILGYILGPLIFGVSHFKSYVQLSCGPTTLQIDISCFW